MIKRIIVPLDGSEHSESALPYAVSFAKALGASVVLLHAVSEPVIDMFADEQIIWDNIDELRESARRASAEYLQRVSARLTADGITNIVHNVYGVAADVILGYATSGSGDLIAMSTHGRSGIRRFVMGSVATRVVNGTDTPLLLVQPQEEAGADVGVTSVFVPLDMSPHSEEVLPLTRELAKAMKLDMSLIMVIPTLSQLFVGTEPAAYPTNALEQVDKYAREYHDHGHENNPNFPRGKDTKTNYGFNYRMTEMQAAVGKVQLGRLNHIIAENKTRYQAIEDNVPSTVKTRHIPDGSDPIYDTFIFFTDSKEEKQRYIRILNDEGFGTKNLPDALEWHCSAFWDHALDQKQVEHSQKTRDLLEKALAVPIWLRKMPEEYSVLAKKLFHN